MAMLKTEIIPITNKREAGNLPFYEYPKVTHPTPESAIAIFETYNKIHPKKMYDYCGHNGKFGCWIIPKEET